MIRAIALLLLLCSLALAQTPVTITRPAYSISFSPTDGSILAFRQANQKDALVQTGPSGLWQLRFIDNTTLRASEFSPEKPSRRLVIGRDEPTVTFLYTSDVADVTITATPADNYLDLRGQVTPHGRTVLDFTFPTQLRFDPATLTRFIAPDADLSAALATRSGIANRGLVTGPDAPETLSLVTSANPSEPTTYIGAQRLGGVGLLWRIGGFNPDPAVSLPTIAQVINHLYTKPPVPSGKAAARRLYHATISSP